MLAILNVTPDSFSDGGLLPTPRAVVAAARRFLRHGADALDIGGESTRPGAHPVPVDQQIARVAPAVRAIREAGIDAPITIDTTRAAVAAAALEAGADAVNDVSGGADDPGMLPLLAARAAGVVLMHRPLPPHLDRYAHEHPTPPPDANVVEDVRVALARLARAALDAGIHREAIVLDPGLGFGKSVDQNAALAAHTPALAALGYPLLAAASRKSFVGRLGMGEADPAAPEPDDRLGGSIAFSLVQMRGGARLFRVHDVAEQARALRIAWRLEHEHTITPPGPTPAPDPRPGRSTE